MFDWETPFIWSDNMYITEGKAWFAGGRVNALFRLDLVSGQYNFVTTFPGSKIIDFRAYRVGTKYSKYILCFPDKGDAIWAYDTDNGGLQRIDLINPDHKRTSFTCAFNVNGKVYAMASGLMQIIELEITDKVCIKYYNLFEEYKQEELEDSFGEESILVGQCIYCIYLKTNIVCEFNIETKEIKYYIIQDVKGGIATICYDGKLFWFSGWAGELYAWDKDKNETKILNHFPSEFGVYEINNLNQLRVGFGKKLFERNIFFKSINSKNDIWFIPFCSNHILYINKHNFEFNILVIPDEIEDIISWTRSIRHKYVVEYVLDNGIIGLYSFKNRNIIELNTEKKDFRVKSFFLTSQDKIKLWNILSRDKVAGYEIESSDLRNLMCVRKLENRGIINNLTGNKIYRATVSVRDIN